MHGNDFVPSVVEYCHACNSMIYLTKDSKLIQNLGIHDTVDAIQYLNSVFNMKPGSESGGYDYIKVRCASCTVHCTEVYDM